MQAAEMRRTSGVPLAIRIGLNSGEVVVRSLDVPVDDSGWAALDPPQRRQRTLEAVKRLLLRESQVQPLLLVIEDLHWIDSETQALLDSLADSLGSIRVLLLEGEGRSLRTQDSLLDVIAGREVRPKRSSSSLRLQPVHRLRIEEGVPFSAATPRVRRAALLEPGRVGRRRVSTAAARAPRLANRRRAAGRVPYRSCPTHAATRASQTWRWRIGSVASARPSSA